MRSLKWIRAVAGTTAVVLVGALLAFNVTRDVSPKTDLIAGTDFTVTSAIKASPACSGGNVTLFPGLNRCLVYTVTNPLSDPVTVDSLTLSMDPAFSQPPSCPSSNLDLTNAGFSGSVVVPANGSTTVNASIKLSNTGSNQNACKNVTFHFLYSGHATYTHVYGTSTALTSSANPSSPAQTVTFTATVSPVGTPPSGPTGSVVFKDGSSTIACLSGSTSFNGSTATCKYAPTASGAHPISAVYSNSDGNFSGSTSNTVTQTVSAWATSSSLVSSLNPSVYGNSVTFTDTVTSAGGTPAGNVTFYDGAATLGTTSLNASGKAMFTTTTLTPGSHSIKAVYAGNGTYASGTSNTVSQVVNYTSTITGNQNGGLTVESGQAVNVTSTGKLNGGATVKSGGILFFNGGTANGGITVQSGGSLFVSGGSINGGITSTGAKDFTICGASINGGVSSSGATGFVLIGDGGDDGAPGCAANIISGNVTLTNNSASVELGGNTINGTVSLTGTTGTPPPPRPAKPQIEANKINGTLTCSGNNPAPTNDGKPNTGSGSRTGQCAGF